MDSINIVKKCKALSDANRIEIVNMLKGGQMNASELLEKLEISQPTLSHHMRQLSDCGMVSSRREGTATVYSLNAECFAEIKQFTETVAPSGDALRVTADISEVSRQETNYQSKLLAMVRDARRESSELSDFIKRMSYELRTPIQSIKGMIMVAKKGMGDLSKLNMCIMKIEEASDQLEHMLDEVLDMREIESTRETIVLQPFNIFDNARELNNMYVNKMYKKGVSFKSEVIGEINHPYILSSRVYARRIFQIILDEALSRTQKLGHVKVSFEELSADGDKAEHRIIIRDDGNALQQEYIDSIFRPFSDDDYREDAGYHTGLALSVVKRLLDRIGGRMEIVSKEGEGTEVTIYVPVTIDTKAEELINSKGESDVAGKRILLVEDNELNMEVAEFILKDAGAIVTCAVDGVNAVEIFKNSAEREFSLILMDVVMPNKNGYEATEEIRALTRDDAKNIPIIAMSANAFENDIEQCHRAGMNEHIAKPLTVSKLMKVINKWIAE